MPKLTEKLTGFEYYVLNYDAHGHERIEGTSLLRDEVFRTLDAQKFTDIFIISHGWLGEARGCEKQYNEWLHAFKNYATGQKRKFHPLVLALHWPSKPLGQDEFKGFDLASEAALHSKSAQFRQLDAEVFGSKDAADLISGLARIAASQDATTLDPAMVFDETAIAANSAGQPNSAFASLVGRKLRELIEAARLHIHSLRADVDIARTLWQAAWLDAVECKRTDIRSFITASNVEIEGFLKNRDIASGPEIIFKALELFSFFRMKDLAHTVGQNEPAKLLRDLQSYSVAGSKIHLLGHSFGCIVVSSMISAAKVNVNSLTLLQGALSIWDYAESIPNMPDARGRFHDIIANEYVKGPIVASQSWTDYAVRDRYKTATSALDAVRYDTGVPPLDFAAVGAFGIRGNGILLKDIRMKDANTAYNLEEGIVYNVDGTKYITGGNCWTGSHSNIAVPEVAHLLANAVFFGK